MPPAGKTQAVVAAVACLTCSAAAGVGSAACKVTAGSADVNPFTPVFYDVSCLGKLDSIECAVDVADDFVAHLAADLRVEASCLIVVQFFLLVCILQTASIPAPKGKLGHALFWTWMALQLLQWIAALLSLVCVLLAFGGASTFLGECRVSFRGQVPLVSLAGLMAAWFHPAVASLAGAVVLSMDSLMQGTMVFAATTGPHVVWDGFVVLVITFVQASTCLVAFVGPAAACALAFLASGAFAFGGAFAPLAAAMLLCFAAVAGVAHAVGFVLARLMPARTATALWWVPALWMGRASQHKEDTMIKDLLIGRSMIWAVRGTVSVLVLSPVVVWGTWLALYTYNGATSAQVSAMIREVYGWILGLFLDADFQVPRLTPDPWLARRAFEAFAELADFTHVPSERMLENCGAMSGLAALLAVLKLPVTALSLLKDHVLTGDGLTVPLAAVVAQDRALRDLENVEELAKFVPEVRIFGRLITMEPDLLT